MANSINSIKANEKCLDNDSGPSSRCMDRCADEASRHKSLQLAMQKVKVPGDQTNKLSVES